MCAGCVLELRRKWADSSETGSVLFAGFLLAGVAWFRLESMFDVVPESSAPWYLGGSKVRRRGLRRMRLVTPLWLHSGSICENWVNAIVLGSASCSLCCAIDEGGAFSQAGRRGRDSRLPLHKSTIEEDAS